MYNAKIIKSLRSLLAEKKNQNSIENVELANRNRRITQKFFTRRKIFTFFRLPETHVCVPVYVRVSLRRTEYVEVFFSPKSHYKIE